MRQLDADVLELQGVDHEHLNDFQHLDLPLEDLERDYDLGWKFDPDEQYPPERAAEPYLVLYVSFGERGGPRQTLHYALTRSTGRGPTKSAMRIADFCGILRWPRWHTICG